MSSIACKPFFKQGVLWLAASVMSSQILASDPVTKEPGIFCGSADKKLYQSESLNIDHFKAAERGLTLVKKQKMPQQKITLYTFKPGPVVCMVRTPD